MIRIMYYRGRYHWTSVRPKYSRAIRMCNVPTVRDHNMFPYGALTRYPFMVVPVD